MGLHYDLVRMAQNDLEEDRDELLARVDTRAAEQLEVFGDPISEFLKRNIF